ncbi:MAG: hypothetical protein ACPG7E_08120, partial [Marinirhabdus sp.]
LLFGAFRIKQKDTVFFIATVGAIISIHNYPPMPWNTIDGLFFCTIGLTFLFKAKATWPHLLAAAVFVGMGVLCKQSFFFVPVFVCVYMLFNKKWGRLLWFVAFGGAVAALFVGILYVNGALWPFYEQIFSFTPPSSLLNTGVRSYYLAFKNNWGWAAAAFALFFTARYFLRGNGRYLMQTAIIAGAFCALYLGEDSFHTVKRGIVQVLFVSTAVFSVHRAITANRAWWLVLLLLGLAWCASISNGFNTPIDFSTPIAFVLFFMCFKMKPITLTKPVGLVVVSVFLITFFIGYQTVYQDSDRSELNYSLSKLFPRLPFVKTDKETFEKYRELKQLASKYDNFTVLPSATLAHYLTGTRNPIGVDWVFNHHLTNKLPDYIEKLNKENITVFLENFENHVNKYEETSALTVYVAQHWKVIEKGDHFRVLQKR